jgi:hypothetical protein
MLRDLLRRHCDQVLERWFGLILESFHPDSRKFLRREGDQFNNPVGHTLREQTGIILHSLIEEKPAASLEPPLERILKIRAVQDCPPSEAISFIFLLKRAIREELAGQLNSIGDEVSAFEQRIDGAALVAFDYYMQCREKIYTIKERAEKMQLAKVLERLNETAGGATEVPEKDL